MSSNELNFDKSNQMLQAERNCINFDGSKKFNVNYKAMSYDDKCFIDTDTRSSIGVGNYRLFSPYSCECLMPETVKHATDNVTVSVGRNGVDVGACVIDQHSEIRWGLQKKHPKCPQQLFERPYKTTPLMAKGVFNADQSSELQFAEDTRVKRSCNTLSGITVPQVWTPMIDHIKFNTQNPVHIIEEVGSNGAMRHGSWNSRLIIRDYDYATRCGKAYMNKSTNSDFWANKGSLLQQ
jgi:hypothetical protein